MVSFSPPHGVAVDSYGYVYVTDTGNNRIEKFGPDGTYLQTYGASAGLKSPIGIAVDKSGDIYVADDGNNQIVEFDSNGNTIVGVTLAQDQISLWSQEMLQLTRQEMSLL